MWSKAYKLGILANGMCTIWRGALDSPAARQLGSMINRDPLVWWVWRAASVPPVFLFRYRRAAAVRGLRISRSSWEQRHWFWVRGEYLLDERSRMVRSSLGRLSTFYRSFSASIRISRLLAFSRTFLISLEMAGMCRSSRLSSTTYSISPSSFILSLISFSSLPLI